jgi:hypothetical protein
MWLGGKGNYARLLDYTGSLLFYSNLVLAKQTWRNVQIVCRSFSLRLDFSTLSGRWMAMGRSFSAVAAYAAKQKTNNQQLVTTRSPGSLGGVLLLSVGLIHLCHIYILLERLNLNSRLTTGMHPDQATEAIVDLALRLCVPFAVVPCCVYPSLFPHRRLLRRPGQRAIAVRSYATFCDYLLDKGPPPPSAGPPSLDDRPLVGHGAAAAATSSNGGEVQDNPNSKIPFAATTLPFRGKCRVIYQPTEFSLLAAAASSMAALALLGGASGGRGGGPATEEVDPTVKDRESLKAMILELEACEERGDGPGALRFLKASEAGLLRGGYQRLKLACQLKGDWGGSSSSEVGSVCRDGGGAGGGGGGGGGYGGGDGDDNEGDVGINGVGTDDSNVDTNAYTGGRKNRKEEPLHETRLLQWKCLVKECFETTARACVYRGQWREAVKTLKIARRLWPMFKGPHYSNRDSSFNKADGAESHSTRHGATAAPAPAAVDEESAAAANDETQTRALLSVSSFSNSAVPVVDTSRQQVSLRDGGASSSHQKRTATGSDDEIAAACIAAVQSHAAAACENGGKLERAAELRETLSSGLRNI